MLKMYLIDPVNLFFFVLIHKIHKGRHNFVREKIKMLYIALLCNLCLAAYIFHIRFLNNTSSISYSNKTYPYFQIQKTNQLNYFIFPSNSWKSNKTKRIIKDFTTLHPGKTILIPSEKLSPNSLNY